MIFCTQSIRQWKNGSNASQSPMHQGMQSRSVQIHSSIKGKEILSTPDEVKAAPFMEREDVEEIYTTIFSKGDTDMILSCNVENLNLENFNISDPSPKVQGSGSRKRKALADISDEDLFSANKRREVLDAVNEGIVQISPGNWGDVGYGVVTNESWLQFAFFPKSFTESSYFINSIEFKKRGTRFGSRRLTLIKNAARRKHCLEITRQAFENVVVIEMGIDPYGNNIEAIPILEEINEVPVVNMSCIVPTTTSLRGRQWVVCGIVFPRGISNDHLVCRVFMNDPYAYAFCVVVVFTQDAMLVDQAVPLGYLGPGVFKLESLMIRPSLAMKEGACLHNELSQVLCSITIVKDGGFPFSGLFICRILVGFYACLDPFDPVMACCPFVCRTVAFVFGSAVLFHLWPRILVLSVLWVGCTAGDVGDYGFTLVLFSVFINEV
ncbi:hypothetical protein GQ457_03G043120 [Hibiscus cannabinus]